jgi:hypothetical protein
MRYALALFACALIGCGSPGAASQRGNDVAQRFQAACQRAPVSTPKAAQVIRKLCSCTAKKLRSSVRNGDGDDIVESKIETARRACLRKIYPNGI